MSLVWVGREPGPMGQIQARFVRLIVEPVNGHGLCHIVEVSDDGQRWVMLSRYPIRMPSEAE